MRLASTILVTITSAAFAQHQQPAPGKAVYRMLFLHSDCF